LKQIKSKTAVQYRRGHVTVVNFPDSTSLRVEFSPEAPQFDACSVLPAFDPARVQFRVQWRNDSQATPAEGKFVISKEPVAQTWCEERCVARWSYELRIDSQNVPLQNDLVINIETQDGTRLAEYVGKLTSNKIQPEPPFQLPAPH
jgi:hypothetical protein